MRGLITSDYDRDNLNFLLNTKGAALQTFWAQSDEDDKLYAQELIDAYSRELKMRTEALEIEAQLDNVQDAKAVLKKFAL